MRAASTWTPVALSKPKKLKLNLAGIVIAPWEGERVFEEQRPACSTPILPAANAAVSNPAP